jgi:hypothetical protein
MFFTPFAHTVDGLIERTMRLFAVEVMPALRGEATRTRTAHLESAIAPEGSV